VVGCNPYETRRQCLGSKVWKCPPFKGGAAVDHGNKYEDEAVEVYEKYTGHKVLHFGLLESLHQDKESFLAGSPDGITSNGRLIEVKCPYYRSPNGVVPKMYMFQLQHLMNTLDLEVCDFIEYVPETTIWSPHKMWIIEVKRSRQFWAYYMPSLRRFWDDVVSLRLEAGEGAEETMEPQPEKPVRAPAKKRHHPMLINMSTAKEEFGEEGVRAYPEEYVPRPNYADKRQKTSFRPAKEEDDTCAQYGSEMIVDLSGMDFSGAKGF
jgi:putative phage-type endonuclease